MADNYVEKHRADYEQWKARQQRKRQQQLRRQLAEIIARRRHGDAGNTLSKPADE